MDEKKLKRLAKHQLIHLLVDVVGIAELEQNWRGARSWQADRETKCWDCEEIAIRLEE